MYYAFRTEIFEDLEVPRWVCSYLSYLGSASPNSRQILKFCFFGYEFLILLRVSLAFILVLITYLLYVWVRFLFLLVCLLLVLGLFRLGLWFKSHFSTFLKIPCEWLQLLHEVSWFLDLFLLQFFLLFVIPCLVLVLFNFILKIKLIVNFTSRLVS